MAKTTHTHTGTCQACGAVQAVDNASRLIAKHGYKVAGFGFFNGVCQGSGRAPAEHDITLTHSIMASCEAWAVDADRLADLWRTGALMVTTHESWTGRRTPKGSRIYQYVMMFGCDEYTIGQRRGQLEYAQESQAKNARAHAESLLTHVIPRFGRPLYVSKATLKRVFAKGDEVINKHAHKLILVTEFYSHGFSGSRRVSGWRASFVNPIEGEAGKTYYISMVELRKYNT